MGFKQLLPVAITISLIASIYVFFAQYFQIKAIWLPFVSWSLYSLSGGKKSNIFKIIFGLTVGMYIGCITVILSGFLSAVVGLALASAMITFIMVFIILNTELHKPIDLIPAYFFSYSGFFAYYYGNFGRVNSSPLTAIPDFFLLLMLGIILGVSTTEIRNKIIIRKKSRK